MQPTAYASVSVAFVFFITAAVGSLPSNAEEKDAEKCPCQAMDQWIAVLFRRCRNGILPSMWKAESIQKLESSGAALTQSVELILDVQERFANVPNGPGADRVTSKLKAVLDKNPGYVLKQVSNVLSGADSKIPAASSFLATLPAKVGVPQYMVPKPYGTTSGSQRLLERATATTSSFWKLQPVQTDPHRNRTQAINARSERPYK
ncbi:hypothetical protein HPB50_006679 [Hyalomma asiaticum]|uniref:Uncharacterized protein n=1 Tax=Hyalomma asiaticum TaxID=266040 RepID=A0ACB7S830_HYAAI|nr:hypothetical protein HPB50_006679 [Hyalomma asiaticum]